jgi:hypothetical protein
MIGLDSEEGRRSIPRSCNEKWKVLKNVVQGKSMKYSTVTRNVGIAVFLMIIAREHFIKRTRVQALLVVQPNSRITSLYHVYPSMRNQRGIWLSHS